MQPYGMILELVLKNDLTSSTVASPGSAPNWQRRVYITGFIALKLLPTKYCHSIWCMLQAIVFCEEELLVRF